MKNFFYSLLIFPLSLFGQNYSLDFSYGNYGRIPTSETLSNFESFTMEFWYYHTSVSNDDEHIVGTEYFGGNRYVMGSHNGRLWPRISDGNNGIGPVDYYSGSISNQYLANTWTHLAMSYNGEVLSFFINGELIDSEEGQIASFGPINEYLVINRHTWDTGSSSRLTGQIDELRISNTARYSNNFIPQTEEFISDEFTAGLWHFNNDFNDYSGNGNHGTHVGTSYSENTPILIIGCADPLAYNYNPEATEDDGSCEYFILGCTDVESLNYDEDATQDDGSCEYKSSELMYSGCDDPEANNYNPNATINDSTCFYDHQLLEQFDMTFASNFNYESIQLEEGKDYKIVISGSYGVAWNNGKDAAYYFQCCDWSSDEISISNEIWLDGTSYRPITNHYKEHHEYVYSITGSNQPLVFEFSDVAYGDNFGSLNIEIWNSNSANNDSSSTTSNQTINVPNDYSTIQEAIDASSDGDTIMVSPGTYIESTTLQIINKQVSIISTSGPEETIISGNNSHRVLYIENPINSEIVFEGFTVSDGIPGSDNHASAIKVESGKVNCHNLIIENNGNGGGNTVAYGSGIDNTFFRDCIIRNNSVENYAGLRSSTNIRCILYGNSGWNNTCVLLDGYSENCVVYNNGGGYGSGLAGGNAVNCIFWNNSGNAGWNAESIKYSNVQGGHSGEGNIDSDPLFTDPGNDNFTLLAGSPCIDSGDPDSSLDPDGTVADMGAYYFDQGDPTVIYGCTDPAAINYEETANLDDGSCDFFSIDTTISDIINVPEDYSTIQEAIDASDNGDEIQVSAGTYYVNDLNVNKDLTITGEDISNTFLHGSGSHRIMTISSPGNSLLTISNFTITDGHAQSNGGYVVGFVDDNDYSVTEFNHIVFENNGGNTGGVIFRGNGWENTTYKNCIVRNNTAENYAGLGSSTVIGTVLYGNSGWNNTGVLQNCNSFNCTVYNNSGGFMFNPWTVGGMTDGVATNCIFWGNGGYNGQQTYNAESVTYSNVQGGHSGEGNIDSDPLFTDLGNNDFTLLTGSPCIDSGDPDSSLDPDGTVADMGAYYFDQYAIDESINDIDILTDSIVSLNNLITSLDQELYEALENQMQVISINLLEGWNIIGYTLYEPQDAVATLQEITDIIEIVKNNAAEVYWPEYGFNGIGDLIPGQGYQIKVTEEYSGFTYLDTEGQRIELTPTVPQWAIDMEVEMHPNDIRTLVRVVNLLGQEVNPEMEPKGSVLLYLYNDATVEKKLVE